MDAVDVDVAVTQSDSGVNVVVADVGKTSGTTLLTSVNDDNVSVSLIAAASSATFFAAAAASSSSAFFVFFGAPNALNHALRFGVADGLSPLKSDFVVAVEGPAIILLFGAGSLTGSSIFSKSFLSFSAATFSNS